MITLNLKTAVKSRKSAQTLDAPDEAEKCLITNKVNTNFPASPGTAISYTSLSRSTAVSRFKGSSLFRYGLFGEVAGNKFPIHQVPEGLDVFWACIPVVNVIGMLPYVAGQQRLLAVG